MEGSPIARGKGKSRKTISQIFKKDIYLNHLSLILYT